MSVAASAEASTVPARAARRTTPAAALASLGIVYGDLGTSPLYTLQAITQTIGGRFTPEAAIGVLSLILWALVITISIKYCLFVMRADNHGEGGILALMPLAGASGFDRARALVVMGLFGAALIYGDGIITPAISVLSALEGVNVATDALEPYVTPVAVAILLCLFAVQGRGTARIGKVFGPLMLLWFGVIAVLGTAGIVHHPQVLAAVDPRHAIAFLVHNGWGGFAVLGGVFLAITGGEALYADMGHIGRNPIMTTWYGIVLPALLLNYAGQTAFLLDHPIPGGNPFFELAPDWAIFPLVLLATVATIIASQAIITGSFSLTRQAMQLGWFPGLRLRQTSDEEYGQIYVPFVNWTMMLFTIALTVGFGSSGRLAGAYGTAVSTTMLLTTALLYKVMRDRWGWSAPTALLASGVFLVVDFAFFAANLLKIVDGGWIPLTFGAIVFIVMTTWHSGIGAMVRRHATMTEPPERFLDRLEANRIPRVPGTAVFLTRIAEAIPPLMIQHVSQIGALPQTVVALTVKFEEIPRVRLSDRLELVRVFEGFWHLTVHYGFVEIPDLPSTLRAAKDLGCPVDLDDAVYFGAHDAVVPGKTGGRLLRCRLMLFAFLFRNSVRAVDLFNLPPPNFVEIGRQIEI
ncbi:MAG TPA: KUP/HAK/KT family potassium transporter [Stellaceae bacterium]|nr:KUP/HAK/KT family potassium transporter [Stellaceae bacterium]